MKVINIGLSVLLSMGLAISPLYANDDVSLEETEVEKEDSNTEVEAYAQEKSVLYTLSTSDGITDYTLNNGDTKTVRLKVTDEKGQETNNYTYRMVNYSSDLYVTNQNGKVSYNVDQPGNLNELTITKDGADKGFISFIVNVGDQELNLQLNFIPNNTITATLNAGDGYFDLGLSDQKNWTTTDIRDGKIGSFPVPVAPDGYVFDSFYDEDGNPFYNVKITKDTVFYARYKKAVTITFDPNGGNGSAYTQEWCSNKAYYVSDIHEYFTHPDGKKFYGFKDGDTGIVYSREQEIPIGTTPKTLYAVWGDLVNVRFYCNGGYCEDLETFNDLVVEGQISPRAQTIPYYEGKRFTGWHIGSPSGQLVDPNTTKFYSDTELYASYEDVKEPSQVQVHIDYDMNSLEYKTFEVKEGEFFYLSSYNPSNCPEGMEIIGYKVVGTNRVIKPYDRISFDKETNLKAIWKKLVKVTYDSNGAGYSQVANYLSAGSNVASDNPFGQSPKGKVLKGWAVGSPQGKVVQPGFYGDFLTKDTTLYAVWEDGYKLTLDLGKDAEGYLSCPEYFKKGDSIGLSCVQITNAPKGKVLAGFKVDGHDKLLTVDDQLRIQENTVLHAVWDDGIHVTVKDPTTLQVLNEENIAKNTRYSVDNKINQYVPEGQFIQGYRINSVDGEIVDSSNLKFDSDVVLYPVFTQKHKVYLDWGYNGGNGYISGYAENKTNNSYVTNNYLNFPSVTVLSTPRNKVLAGWRVKGTDTVYRFSNGYLEAGGVKIDSDVYLEAVWEDELKLTLDANGEKFFDSSTQSEKTISKDQVVTQYDLTCGRTYENITNEDGTKVVVGWRVNSPTGELLDKKLSYTFDSNTKLYAVWQNVVNVTFEYDDFVVGKFANSELPMDYIQNMLEKPYEYCPFGEGEVFVGWYNKDTNEKLTKNTKITKDCTYVARVSKSNPKVTIDYNDGNGLLKDIELIGGYTNLYYFNDSLIEAPQGKVFVGFSKSKNGELIKTYPYDLQYFDKDTTLYAKYADTVTLTVHEGNKIYEQKVPVNTPVTLLKDYDYVINKKHYYVGQTVTFDKNTDIELKQSKSGNGIYVSYVSNTSDFGYLSYTEGDLVRIGQSTEYILKARPGNVVTLQFNDSLAPEGMKFDHWITPDNVQLDNPKSKTTQFVMPQTYGGDRAYIYVAYKETGAFTLSNQSLDLAKGQSQTLSVNGDYESITWKSSNPSVVKVGQNGRVTALKSGKATVQVTNDSGKTLQCVITVTNKLKSLSFSDKEVSLQGKVDKKLSLVKNPDDADYEKLTWISSNDKVVKVSEDGMVSTVSCGEATITVKSESGLSASCKVKVNHDWKVISQVDATEQKEGNRVLKCNLCNETKEETIPKLTGKWVTDSNGKWYKYSDGTYEKSGFKKIQGKTYYFQSNGYVKTGWLSLNNSWYMFNADGSMIIGWHGDYYFDENGKMKTNAFVEGYYLGADGKYVKNQWIKDGGKDYFMDANGKARKNAWQGAYYLGADGVMMTNTFTPDGFYVGSDGAYYTNRWFKNKGKDYYVNVYGNIVKNAWIGSYYLGNDGAMLTNTFTPDGFYVGENGVYLRNQKINVDGKDYYLNAVGKVAKNQWVGDYYLDENGNVVKNSWAGSYWCGEDGKYVRNTFTPDEYYCGSDGVYVRNRWIKVDGKDYYMNGYGKMAKNTWSGAYYLGADGVMLTNAFTPDGFYVGTDGAYYTNRWFKNQDKDYYVDGSGKVVKNAWVGSYYLGEDGAMLTNTFTPDGYYVGADGLWSPSKWIQSGSYWWYRHSDGTYTTNDFEVISNQIYYFDSNGYMVTGWKQIGLDWYYFNDSGVMVKDAWVGNYYFESDGKMATNKWIGNYYVGEDGCVVTNQWIGVYYVGSNGAMATGWQCISGKWYYFDSNGIYQTGERYLGGEYYYFNSQGVMQTGTAEDGWEYNSSGQRMVYWSKRSNNPIYHRTPDNISPKNLVRGTYSQAVAAGKTNRCKTC